MAVVPPARRRPTLGELSVVGPRFTPMATRTTNGSPATAPLQPDLLAGLGTPLREVDFCVVDLETTGGADDSEITEVGAVRVRGGVVTGEFQTLVNPVAHIPAVIAVLTGITDSMVASAPRLAEVLPAFLQFASGCVLVAHNARFDTGFLKRACQRLGYPWPAPTVVDTVGVARSVMLRDEVPNHRLATLAAHFHASTTPSHRALADARATVDVLHALLERVGNLGVHTLEDLVEVTRRVSPQRRSKRLWAQSLPEAPGVYVFVCDTPSLRQYLYVGTSGNIRRRVRTYFTAAEKRPRIDEMVRVATGVEATVCRTALEAEVLELRLIAAHAPRYNRRSKYPERQHWVKLTRETFPRLSVVRAVTADGCRYFGPFRGRAAAQQALLAVYDATPVRQCTERLSARTPRAACALAGVGRCSAPCELGPAAESYADLVAETDRVLGGDTRPVVGAAERRLLRLADELRFEEAADVRARLDVFQRTAVRLHRTASLAGCAQIVAARAVDAGWEIHVVRHGRLVGAAVARPGDPPLDVAAAAVASAETVLPPPLPHPAATIEETERIASWLETPGVRLIDIDGTWAWPIHVGHRLDDPVLTPRAVVPAVATATTMTP